MFEGAIKQKAYTGETRSDMSEGAIKPKSLNRIDKIGYV
jgi:hypothetical protein